MVPPLAAVILFHPASFHRTQAQKDEAVHVLLGPAVQRVLGGQMG